MKFFFLQLFTPKEKFSLIILLILNVIAACLEIISLGVIPLFVSIIIDTTNIKFIPIVGPMLEETIILKKLNFDYILFYSSISLVLIFFIKNLFLFYLILFETKISKNLKISYGIKLFKFYITQPIHFHLSNDQSKLIRNMQLEASKAVSVIFLYINMLKEFLFLIAASILLIFTNFLTTIIIFIILSISSLFYFFLIKKKLALYGIQNLKFKTERIKFINFSLSSIKDIQIFLSEFWISKKFSINTTQLENNIRKSSVIQKSTRLYLELIGIIVILIISFLTLSEQNIKESLPILSLFVLSIIKLTPSINIILSSLSGLKFNKPSLNAIGDHIIKYNLKPVLLKKITNNKKIKKIKKIQLQNVSFKNNDQKDYLFKNLNLEFYCNNIYGIIGKSGSGKSTFLNLISSLIKPLNGIIKIDGKKLNFKDINYIRNLGYVGQDSKLIHGTLRDNITFGNSERKVNDLDLKKLIKDVGLTNFYKRLDNGFDTLIEDDGKNISGGEKQRIIICRSLFKSSSVLLFDEPTSGLDNNNEYNILSLIKNLKKDKIIFMSFHNLKHKKICDYLLKINENNQIKLIKD